MIGRFLTPFHRRAYAPDGVRLYAVGDIHGRLDLLDRLLDMIAQDRRRGETEARLVFLGDYVDRGPDSRSVVDRLIEIADSAPDTVFLLGNHEQAMLEFLAQPDEMARWLDWGGAATAISYGVEEPHLRAPAAVAEALSQNLPAAHRSFLSCLATMHEAEDYLFVHAGVRPGVALADQTPEDLLWIREEFLDTPKTQRPEKVVVHGHTPVKSPQDAGWRINVDTGAGWDRMLSCVVLEGKRRRFLSARV